ncbi:MAG TPA: FYDLN acid domain-containing protein [Myxococcota bacterium]|nr:FYDLN acid domain-containing protein [Myxococcota bacterium]
MTRPKGKTVKKKPAIKKQPAPKKKPVAKKTPPKPISKPDKKKAAKPDARAAKPEKKAAATKSSAPTARDLEIAERFAPEARAKKAPKVRPSRAREPGKRPDLPLPTPVERPAGAAGQLGEKYVCFSCGAKFYDLGKPEPRCPKCGADQREAPRQVRPRPSAAPEAEERPVKRSRLLDEDEDEIVLDTDTDSDADDDLDLGLGAIDEGEDFGPDEPEEEEPEEEP